MKKIRWFIPVVVIAALVLGTVVAVAMGVIFTDEFTITVKGPPVEVTKLVKPKTELSPGEETVSVYAIKNQRGETSKVGYIVTSTKSPSGYDVAKVKVYSGSTNPPQGSQIPDSGTLEIGVGETLYLGIYCKIYATTPPEATLNVKLSLEDLTGVEPIQ